ncbi:MAG: DMT family transporter [Streptomycetales bacterium]
MPGSARATSLWMLALALRAGIEVGVAYAVWSAVGTAAVATYGILVWGESASALKLASLALILVGVVGLNLAGTH